MCSGYEFDAALEGQAFVIVLCDVFRNVSCSHHCSLVKKVLLFIFFSTWHFSCVWDGDVSFKKYTMLWSVFFLHRSPLGCFFLVGIVRDPRVTLTVYVRSMFHK